MLQFDENGIEIPELSWQMGVLLLTSSAALQKFHVSSVCASITLSSRGYEFRRQTLMMMMKQSWFKALEKVWNTKVRQPHKEK